MQDMNDYKISSNTDLVKDGALNFVDAHEVAFKGIGRSMGSI